MTTLILIVLFYVVFLLYVLSLHMRRWHDLGHSGWWALLNFIPIVGLVALIYLLFAKGDGGQNAYGAPNVGQPFWRSVFAPGSLAAQPAMTASAVAAAPLIPSAPVNPVPSTPIQQPPQQPLVVPPQSNIPSAPVNPPPQQ